MNERAAAFAAVMCMGVGLWLYVRRADAAPAPSARLPEPDYGFEGIAQAVQDYAGVGSALIEDAVQAVTPGAWDIPPRGEMYRAAINAAEASNGIPRLLLARLLYQESHYREDIISGRTKSPTGAIGIAQFMPATAAEMGIDPFDPFASIAGAGRYLKRLYNRFSSWDQALAAYNWGQGNQAKDLRDGIVGNEWPTETKNYVQGILADVRIA